MAIELSTKQIILLILMICILVIIVILGIKYSEQIKDMFVNLLEKGPALTPM